MEGAPPDVLAILAWNFAKIIVERTAHLGAKYLLPVPPLLSVPLDLLHRGILGTLGFFARFPPLRAAWRPVYWIPVAAALAGLFFVKPRALPAALPSAGTAE